jgi:hypothetical protein
MSFSRMAPDSVCISIEANQLYSRARASAKVINYRCGNAVTIWKARALVASHQSGWTSLIATLRGDRIGLGKSTRLLRNGLLKRVYCSLT